ncbi:MAG: type II toxin-antitoxin system VapB family antitoxin [Rhodospirillales bacterium]
MTFSIKNREADRLARELARWRNKSITAVITDALRAELEQEKAGAPAMADRLMRIGARYAALPNLDVRSDEEILGCSDDLP